MIRSHFLSTAASSAVALDLPRYAASVTFGVIAPFTGGDKRLGEQLADGVRAAADDANRLRRSYDLAFALRTFDDLNSVGEAIVQAGFANGDTSIVGMIGHISSRATLGTLQTYASAGMPLVVPVTTDDRVTSSGFHNVFRLPAKDTDEGILFANSIAQTVKPTNVHVFVQDADYGTDVANGFLSEMASRKITTSFTQFAYEKPNFAAAADRGLGYKPDYIFLAGTVADMGPLLPALRSKGYVGGIGASQGFFDAKTPRLGTSANDLLISSSMPYLPFAPSTIRARSDFESHYGPMGPLQAFGYAAGQLLIAAVRRVGGTPARNSVARALSFSAPTETVVGNYAFTPAGDSVDPQIYFYTVRDGKFAYVRQAHPSPFSIK